MPEEMPREAQAMLTELAKAAGQTAGDPPM
jgi:hypothetical protein